MFIQKETISLTTDGSGAIVGYSQKLFSGEVRQVIYNKGTFDNGVGVTVQAESTSETILSLTNANSSANYAPRIPTHAAAAGAAALYAGGGSAVNDRIVVANERIKVTIASGGNIKTGSVTVLIGG